MNKTTFDTIEINLHGMNVSDALYKLNLRIETASRRIRCIRVIHGYNSGSAIKAALTTKNLPSLRISSIEHLFLNEGVTLIWLK